MSRGLSQLQGAGSRAAGTPVCSVILPTRNRSAILADTLERLAALPDGPFETIVVDNGSTESSVDIRRMYPRVRWIELGRNLWACARNVAAMAANGSILFMLDDDSWPEPGTIDRVVHAFETQSDLGAVACRVRLANEPDRHDAGGVSGAFFNCGAAIRRNAFLAAGGYPIDYDYYVEEYALSCELWRRGWVVDTMGAALVWHRRTSVNRNVDRMIRLLVRNNVRLWDAYAPESYRSMIVESDVDRYQRVARKEGAVAGYEAGLVEAERARSQAIRRRRPLTDAQFDSLLGLDRLRQLLRGQADKRRWCRVAIWGRGKGCEFIVETAKSVGLRVTCVYDLRLAEETCPTTWRGLPIHDANSAASIDADALLVGTLSPGVAEDVGDSLRNRFENIDVVNPAPWGDSVVARRLDAVPFDRSCVA